MAELTLEGLQKQVEDQAKQIEILTGSNADQVKELEILRESNADQVKEVETLKELVSDFNKGREELLKVLSEGTTLAAAEPAKKPEIPTETVEVGKKKYAFAVASFRLPGEAEPNTAEQAITDPKLLAKIVAIKGQTILKEQV